jgi:hypothetical protein
MSMGVAVLRLGYMARGTWLGYTTKKQNDDYLTDRYVGSHAK